MTFDSEVETLAKSGRQKLVDEFREKYTSLQERMRRVPIEEARQIADKFSCPLQIAMMAFIIDMDGILKVRDSVSLIAKELSRRMAVGEPVPNLPGNVQEFVLIEGRWLEYIHGSFVRELELKTRSLSNLEVALGDSEPTVEMALTIFNARNKFALGYIFPIIETWMNEHIKSNGRDVIMAFGPPITKWNPVTLMGKIQRLRRKNQAFFRRLRTVLEHAQDSATVDLTIKRINDLVAALNQPLEAMSLTALSHLLVHIAPRVSGRGDITRTMFVVSPSTRGFKAEPDMTSPFDFLERDIRLAKRRHIDEQEKYLLDKVDRVLRVLEHQNQTLTDTVRLTITEIVDRLNVQNISMDSIMDQFESGLQGIDRFGTHDYTVSFITNFILNHVYGK